MLIRAIVLFAIVLFINTKLFAQATETKFEVQKKQLTAATITIPCSPDVAEEGLKEFMARKGAKPSSYKGLTVFRTFPLDSAGKESSDLYFKIEKKSSKEKDVTLITLLPTKKGEDFQKQVGADQAMVDQSKSFLNQLGPFIESHNINVQLAGQQEVLNKSKKKLAGLLDDSTDLAKKIRKLETELEQNKNDLAKQQKVLDGTSTTDFEAHQKAQKKLNSLSDDKGDLEKKMRKTQADLEQNKKDQETQRAIVQKEQDVLNAIKLKQRPG